MNNFKQFQLCVLLLMLNTLPLIAQPGSCSLVFDYFRTCQKEYATEDFVFIGEVSFIEDKTISVGNNWLWKINVVSVDSIKGDLTETTELYLDQTMCKGSVEIGKKYIFTAHNLKNSQFSRLVSNKWSTALDNISENELSQIKEKIRSVTNKEKQPSLIGKVVKYDTKPFAKYDFRGKSLTTRLGYNPQYSSPLKGIEIIARNGKGETFQTLTDENGDFKFENLATGNYEIYPVLPEKMNTMVFQYYSSSYESVFRTITKKNKFFYISNDVCSEDIRFNIQVSENK